MKVINYFAGPGTGKSTIAAFTFAKLKEHGINAEYVQEYAKDLTWSEHFEARNCQPYVAGKQFWRLARLIDKVDVIVTDSPLINSLLYPSIGCGDTWKQSILEQFNLFDNINIFLTRNTEIHPYNPKGRTQTEDVAKKLDLTTLELLHSLNISYRNILMNSLNNMGDEIDRILIEENIIC